MHGFQYCKCKCQPLCIHGLTWNRSFNPLETRSLYFGNERRQKGRGLSNSHKLLLSSMTSSRNEKMPSVRENVFGLPGHVRWVRDKCTKHKGGLEQVWTGVYLLKTFETEKVHDVSHKEANANLICSLVYWNTTWHCRIFKWLRAPIMSKYKIPGNVRFFSFQISQKLIDQL